MTDEKTEDEGFGIKVGIENGNVIIIFSEKVTTVGLPPKSARKFAKALKKHAIEAENMVRGNGT
jgi:hypothetical protein